MTAARENIEPRTEASPGELPIIVIGAGPVGIRTVQALLRRTVASRIIIYGDEPWAPYNRVQLSSLVAGDVTWSALANGLDLPQDARVIAHHDCAVVSIDRDKQIIVDDADSVVRYARLVIATGSHPHVPGIPGIDKPGVYTFRNMDDAQRLMVRRAVSRRTLVLGGGLLGLEAARAMCGKTTEVVVVEHANRLMGQQLDERGAEQLRAHVQFLGIQVLLGCGVEEVLGDTVVRGVRLRNGQEIECDSVIIATGIRPNIDLALRAGLHIGRGVRVNDRMQTSDPLIYAVGECAEHRDKIYGIVAPGFEQAEVAAHCLLGGDTQYSGSIAATRLKVVGEPVFSIGRIGEEENPAVVRYLQFDRPEIGLYRKIAVQRGRLVGAMAVGVWPQTGRVQENVMHQRRLWPWQIKRFVLTGDLWPPTETQSVCQWPALTTVCNCTGVTRGQLTKAVGDGCNTVAALMQRTGASTVCGGCRPLLLELAGSLAPLPAVRGSRALIAAAGGSLLMALLFLFSAPIPYTPSVDDLWQWDVLWRNNFIKQVSGYAVFGFTLLLLTLSLRKRWQRVHVGEFFQWRVLHVLAGVLALVALIAHTGLRAGHNLNFYLMLVFTGLTFAGAVASGVIALEHRFDPAWARRLRESTLWLHILLFWLFPVLLGFHVLKIYYY